MINETYTLVRSRVMGSLLIAALRNKNESCGETGRSIIRFTNALKMFSRKAFGQGRTVVIINTDCVYA